MDTQPLLCRQWPISDNIYTALDACFNAECLLHCIPYNLLLGAKTYYSEDPRNAVFSFEPLTNTTWTSRSMSLPKFQPDNLTTALEQSHMNRLCPQERQPKPNDTYTPRLEIHNTPARSLHTNYVPKIATLPHTHTKHQHNNSKYNLHVYLVANSKALSQLDATNIHNALTTSLSQEYGQRLQTTKIDTTLSDAQNIDSSKSYTNTPTKVLSHITTEILQTKTHSRRWNPREFLYTDGSQVKGNPTLGAGVVNPNTNTITQIDIKSQP